MTLNAERTFFLTTIPGLESVSHLELCDKWGRASAFFQTPDYPEAHFFRGGFEFKAPMQMGLLLNKHLRTNTRMLIRVGEFDAPNEREFQKHLNKINWSEFFAKKIFIRF